MEMNSHALKITNYKQHLEYLRARAKGLWSFNNVAKYLGAEISIT